MKMRGIAASALKGYNKGQDLHRMNSARVLADVTDVRFGNFGLCQIQSSNFLKDEWRARSSKWCRCSRARLVLRPCRGYEHLLDVEFFGCG